MVLAGLLGPHGPLLMVLCGGRVAANGSGLWRWGSGVRSEVSRCLWR